jgi:hypothetical protein
MIGMRSTDATIEAILRLPGLVGFGFDPVALLRVVNTLPADAVDALEVLRRTLARASTGTGHDDVLLVARAGFESSDPGTPAPDLMVGRPDVEPPDTSEFPDFPIGFVGGLPFLLVGGYLVGGEGPDPSWYLDWCHRQAHRRDRLVPPDDPLASLDSFVERVGPSMGFDETHVGMLRAQALLTVADVYPTGEGDRAELSTAAGPMLWATHRARVAALKIRWDATGQRYHAGAGR